MSTFDQVIDRRDTRSLKWTRYGRDVLPLWVADMDFPAPEPVLQALHSAVDHGVFGYELPTRKLGETVAARMEKLYGWKDEVSSNAVEVYVHGLRKKLENPQFVERAKPEVVAQARQRIAELEERRAKVKATLDELGRLLESGEAGTRPYAAVTVDDGYRDAYDLALPTFRRLGIPAAFFVVTDLVGSREVPLHDRLYYQLARGYAREGRVPRAMWHALDRIDVPPAKRLRLHRALNPFDALQALLESVTQAEARAIAERLEVEAPFPAAVAERFCCADWSMVRAMAEAGMTVGSHTRTHVFLNRERHATVTDQTSGSRRRLEAELGRPVAHFAYPAGQFNPSAVKAVSAAGYRFAYTACRHILPAHARLTIPRKLLWERSCVAADGSFSPSVMNAQVSGLYDLVNPPCALDHGTILRPMLASACC